MKKILSKIQSNRIIQVQIIAIIFSIVCGTLFHFVYQWTGENKIIAAFVPVNESVWEHLKLAFYPMLIAAIAEYFVINKSVNNYIEAKTIGIFTAIIFIVVTFFTYSGIIGGNLMIVDIVIFVLSIILGEYVAYELMTRKNESDARSKTLAIAIILFLMFSFILYTYNAPQVNLFKDPITGEYGI